MAKRALVLKGGTMRGAFLVGALKQIHKELGPDYFDAIFATSVGVFEQAYFASGQIEEMEHVWREYVHGRQLINYMNPLRGRPILDLDYLAELFQSEKARLDVSRMRGSSYRLVTFIADYETKNVKGVSLKEQDPFLVMKATSALPLVYPKEVMIDGRRYVDCWMAPTERFNAALKEQTAEYDEVIAIVTYGHQDRALEGIPTHIVRPTRMPLWGALDTNRSRIIETIEQGEEDMKSFLAEHKRSSPLELLQPSPVGL